MREKQQAQWPNLPEEKRISMLQIPEGPIDMVLDTDAATEVDDPFAISYCLLSPERFRIKAIYAAPFAMNERAQDPAKGMEMSVEEIQKVMRLCGAEGSCPVFHGSRAYLKREGGFEDSPAARDLVKRSREYSWENPLYVFGIGAGTNLASALLMDPEIISRIVVIWLAGNDFCLSPDVYNIYQDVRAAQILFDSGVPLIHVPCEPVTSHMITTVPELESCIGGKNELCDYFIQSVKEYGGDTFAWGKTIWDLGAVGWLKEKGWGKMVLTSAPVVTDELTWSRDEARHLIGNVQKLDRDAIFKDAFLKMGRAGKKRG